jgi:hypothetical protein
MYAYEYRTKTIIWLHSSACNIAIFWRHSNASEEPVESVAEDRVIHGMKFGLNHHPSATKTG